MESLDSDRFWRPHRSYLVNINHIKEVLPWFKSSYMLKMADRRHVRNSREPRADQAAARIAEDVGADCAGRETKA